MSELFRKLKENNGDSRYGFQGGTHPFRDRPGVSSTSRSTLVKPNRKNSSSGYSSSSVQVRTGDRPVAYRPPESQDDDYAVDWEPPTFRELLKDLLLRLLEVGIAALALALGQEIAHFFSKRRLFTSEQRLRRDYQ